MNAPHDQPIDLDRLAVGTSLCGGLFVIEAMLGQGGVATVYRVKTQGGRRVALKLMGSKRASDGDQRERFDNEWRIVRALADAPYVIAVEDNGRHDDGRPFFTMELLDSPTLADLIIDRAVSVARACRIGRQVADALADLHRRGVIHRDIKPENIAVTPDGIRLLDFGYAHTEGAGGLPKLAGLTGVEHRPGTHLYMAPEQAGGGLPTPSFDVYSLAISLYEALVGHAPNSELNPRQMMAYKCVDGLDELSLAGRVFGLPESLVDLVDWGLRRDPAERIGSAAEFRDRLDAIIETLGETELRVGTVGRPPSEVAGELRPGTEVVSTAQMQEQLKSARSPDRDAPTERFDRTEVIRPMVGGGRGFTAPLPDAIEHHRGSSGDGDGAGLEIPSANVSGARAVSAESFGADHRAPEGGTLSNHDVQARINTVMDINASERRSSSHPVAVVRSSNDRRWAIILGAVALLLVGALVWHRLRGDEPAPAFVPPNERSAVAVSPRHDGGAMAPAGSDGGRVMGDRAPEQAGGTSTGPGVEDGSEDGTGGADSAGAATPTGPESDSSMGTPRGVEPSSPSDGSGTGRTPRSGRTRPPKTRPVLTPNHPDCVAEREQANRSHQARRWSDVLAATQRTACWSTDGNRIRLRMVALYESGKFARCATLGAKATDRRSRGLATLCQSRLKETAP